MSSFSQRVGLKPIRVEIQKESLDNEIRNSLWNAIYLTYFKDIYFNIYDNDEPIQHMIYRIWMHHYSRRYDEIDGTSMTIALIKNEVFGAVWNEVLDLLELIPKNYIIEDYNGRSENKVNDTFYEWCNTIFKKALSAYRFIDKNVVEITASEEIIAIEDALIVKDKLAPVQIHLSRALQLFSDRKNPDYRNSIKESISAVEAYCRIITEDEKASLGKALAIIEKQHQIHGSLKTAFSALYGYTSDAEGIRHALLNESDLNQEDAKFMLVTCSAFINYLKIKNI